MKPPHDQWVDPLRAAVEGGASEVVAFHEEREDLSVTQSTGGAPSVIRTAWSGAGVELGRAASPLVYQADPSPEDLAALVAAARTAGESGIPAVSSRGATQRNRNAALEAAAELLHRVAARVERVAPGARVRGRCVGFEQRVRIARTGAEVREDTRRGLRLRIDVHLIRGDRSARATVEAVRGPASPLDAKAGDRLADEAARRAELRLDAVEPSGGERTVVLGPGVGGVLVHEIVGHALEADTLLDGRSWIGTSGGLVAAPGVTVIDDPRRGRAPWRFDDEGTPARPTPLIRDGRVAGRLYDVRTAARAGTASTGHGRRGSYREPVWPRMGCTFVGAGRLHPREVTENIEEGLLVLHMEAATVDPVRGLATFRVTDAERIVDGVRDRPLLPFVLRVDGRKALSEASRVGDDLRFDTCVGSCHRDGQTLTTSVGAPTFCIGVATVCV